MQQPATAPTAPVLAPTQVTVDGVAISSPQAVYQAFRAARRELDRQMESLQDSRESITDALTNVEINATDKAGLEARLKTVDERIVVMDKQLADADAQVARAAAVPGAAVELPDPPRTGPPEEAWVLGGMMIVFVMLPISIAYARRIWRRSAKIITTFPQELSDRLQRVEQSVEATAIEVERIGEGQRFMTKIFTEGPASHLLQGQSAARVAAPMNARSDV